MMQPELLPPMWEVVRDHASPMYTSIGPPHRVRARYARYARRTDKTAMTKQTLSPRQERLKHTNTHARE
eukprot:3610796-Rhodomonas_salina.3